MQLEPLCANCMQHDEGEKNQRVQENTKVKLAILYLRGHLGFVS